MELNINGLSLSDVTATNAICPKHGINLIYMPGKQPFCLTCQAEKIKAKNKAIAIAQTAKWERRKTLDVLRRDSIFDDPDLKSATFDTFVPNSAEAKANLKLARQIAGAYLDPDTHFNTLMTGLPGRGKSHLALSILKAVNGHSKQPVSCCFVSFNELFRLIKASFDDPKSRYTEQAMVSLLSSVDLLVLDDLGSEGSFRKDLREASEFVQNILFGILNQRNRTIITTNLNSREMSYIYNSKIISRINKGIRGHIIKFTEATPDRRSVEY